MALDRICAMVGEHDDLHWVQAQDSVDLVVEQGSTVELRERLGSTGIDCREA